MEIPFNARIIITHLSQGIPDTCILDNHSWEIETLVDMCRMFHVQEIHQFGVDYKFDMGELRSFEYPQAKFDLSRQFRNQTNFLNFVKLFEAYCAIVNALDYVSEVRFDLL